MYKVNVKISKSSPKKVLHGLDVEKMPKGHIFRSTAELNGKRPLKALKAGSQPPIDQGHGDESMTITSKKGAFVIPSKDKQTVSQLKTLIKNKYKLGNDAVIEISANGTPLADDAQVNAKAISCSVTIPHSTYSRKKGDPEPTTTTTTASAVETTTQAPVIETTTAAPVSETTTIPVVETTTVPTVETTTVAP